jgi:hypothetical protein
MEASDLSPKARDAFERAPDRALFLEVDEVLKRTFREGRDEGGGYNASRAYQSLYRNGARDSVSRAIWRQAPSGFGRVIEAGRVDLSYEWLALNPRWNFSEEVRSQASNRLTAYFEQSGLQS